MEWETIFGVGSQQIIARLDLQPAMRVLDVGCGSGRLTLPIAAIVGEKGEVVGLDARAKPLQKLQQRAAQQGLSQIRTLHSAIETANLPPEHFDWALLVGVLGETSDKAAALRHIYATLKPNGKLSVTEGIVDPHRQSRIQVEQLAKEAGFIPCRFFKTWASFTINFRRAPAPQRT